MGQHCRPGRACLGFHPGRKVIAGLVFLGALLGGVTQALAIDYRSVDNVTVLYDAPSNKGKPLFVIHRYTPVEIVVSVEGWAKVRDAEGGMAWIEKKYLSDRRTLLVTADRAQIRQNPDGDAPLVFEAARRVALEWVEAGPAGWIKVRHRDGQTGFVRAAQVWGF